MIEKETKQERDERKAKQRTIKKTIYFGLTLMALLTLIFGVMWAGSVNQTDDVSRLANVDAVMADDQTIGDKDNAKAVLVEYSDFQCPACAFYAPLVKEILAAYETEGLLFVYRHFPLTGHAHALITAKASEAAGLQGQFWPMHDLIFEHQDVWITQSPEEVRKALLSYATDLGLEMEKFITDMDSDVVAEKIQRDLVSGRRAGVRGTPTFYLDGQEVSVRTLDQFRALIQEVLNTTSSEVKI